MSREGSPDWLRTFEVPTTQSVLSFSSDSRSSLNDDIRDKSEEREATPCKAVESDDDDDDVDNEVIGKFIGKSDGSMSDKKLNAKSPKKGRTTEEHVPPKKKKSDASKKRTKAAVEKPSKDSILVLSSDFEPEDSPPINDDGESSDLKMSQLQSIDNTEDTIVVDLTEESPSKQASKGKPLKKSPLGKAKSPKKEKEKNNLDSIEIEGTSGDVEVAEKEALDKQIEPHVSSSTLPLVIAEKVHRTKALVECEKDSIDLSGDMGAVGRVIISESGSGQSETSLDLKGTVYKTTIVPSRTFCVVSFGPSEAKIEAIMNDFIQLKPETYEAETMVEGTLESFLFDSEDEADKVSKTIPRQTDKDEDTGEQMNGKTKGKADNTSKVVKKRAISLQEGNHSHQRKQERKLQLLKSPGTKNDTVSYLTICAGVGVSYWSI